jgi:hypothetical protein
MDEKSIYKTGRSKVVELVGGWTGECKSGFMDKKIQAIN